MVRHTTWLLVSLEIGSDKENSVMARRTVRPLVNLKTECEGRSGTQKPFFSNLIAV